MTNQPRLHHHAHAAEAATVRALQTAGRAIRPYLTIGAALFLAIVLVFIVVFAAAAARRARIARAFAVLAEADTIDGLRTLARDYDGTSAGAAAAMQLAQRLYGEGRFAEAATRFSLFCQSYPEHELFDAARLGEAYALEADGKLLQAEKRFRNLGEEMSETMRFALSMDAFAGAARCAQLQGKLAEAETWYQRAIDTGTQDGGAKAAITEALAEVRRMRAAPEVAAAPADPAETSKPAAVPAPVPAEPAPVRQTAAE